MILISELVFVVYLVSCLIYMVRTLRKKFSPGFVPSSVYERAVVWYQELDEMPESQRFIEYARWKRFIEGLPRRKERLRILSKK